VTDFESNRFSINEIEQLCLKAARGGSELGIGPRGRGGAAAWLVLHGMDCPAYLLQLLRLGPFAPPHYPWGMQSGLTCPICLGASLCDYAELPKTNLHGQPLDLEAVVQPALLLPFPSRMAGIKGHALKITGGGPRVILSPAGDIAVCDPSLPFDAQSRPRLSAWGFAPETNAAVRPWGVPVQTMDALNSFAMRTTVPSSDASEADAGASDRDQD